MENIFSNQGYFYISDRIVKYLNLNDLSQLSKVNKSLATSTARFWFQRFLNKFQLEPQLQEFYTNLMSHSNSDIKLCLGYILRIRVEYGIELKIQPYKWLCQTNCPLALSLILNQVPLTQLILNQFSNEVEDFSLAIKLVMIGDFSLDFLDSLLMQWRKINPSENKTHVLKFDAEHGYVGAPKLQKLLEFGIVPVTEIKSQHYHHSFDALDMAVENGHIGIVKALIPFHDRLDKQMKLAISNENIEMIEILFRHCNEPSTGHESKTSWRSTWSFYAAIHGKDKALQKLIALEDKCYLPSKLEEQFLYVSEIIDKGSLLSQSLRATEQMCLTTRIFSSVTQPQTFSNAILGVSENWEKTLIILLSCFQDLKAVTDNQGNTLLHKAAISGNIQFVRILIDAGIGLTTENMDGLTPMESAVIHGHLCIIKDFIHHYEASKYLQLLHIAMRVKENKIKQFLQSILSKYKDECGNTFVHIAFQEGRLDLVKVLLSNEQNNCLVSPMHLAVREYAKVTKTIRKGRKETNFYNLLKKADELVEIVKMISLTCINHDCQDFDGNTALHIAAREGSIEIVRILMPLYKNLQIKNKKDNTPIDLTYGRNDAVRNLLMHEIVKRCQLY